MTIENDMKPITKHPQYYLRDGNVAFVVEKQLFRVHRYFFERESEFFCNYFTASEESDGTDDKPFALDVKSEDFAKFLWVWYNSRYRYGGQPKDTWLVILTLAARWSFESMRELAIHQLERFSMSPVERIALYKQHKINKRLLIPSYVELCKSPTLPSPAEAEQLQMETVLRIAAARERALLRAAEDGCLSPTSALLRDEELVTIIDDVFEMGGTTDHPGTNGTNGTSSHSGSNCPTIKTPTPATNKVVPQDKGKGKSFK
ncbi:hypothetical protein F5J12DRAFT_828949 [Pisolithus orientalis]|uniref:uncharacterized protein n=1 Tax=Pisolithus orientalis TaxID=936130 RepID=UPI002224C0A7|nr:uncharacterized protein F5J12DRAFT_828949 [Pisolithus orientalis]KAI6007563.1 hypothetical protein F5J12DRAFT_828949 [Pisolithus orientalis]